MFHGQLNLAIVTLLRQTVSPRGVGSSLLKKLTCRLAVILCSQQRMRFSLRCWDRDWCDEDLSIPNIEGSITVQIVRNVSPTCARRDQ